jgi:HSP20 family molecular chaperone IbpA
MVRRYRRSIYDELDDLRASMDYLFQLVLEPVDVPLLPGEETPERTGYPHPLTVETTGLDHEVIVTVGMIPGVESTGISCELVDPGTVTVSCDRREEKSIEQDGCQLREVRICSMIRTVPLPARVTKSGARSTVKNGVLEIHLRKERPRNGFIRS